MDSTGTYTDRHGRRLEVGATIRVQEGYDVGVPHPVTGTIVALPKAGTDYHGYPLVAIDGVNLNRRYVPDSALERTDPEPGSVQAHIQALLNAVTMANTAKEGLLAALEAAGPTNEVPS